MVLWVELRALKITMKDELLENLEEISSLSLIPIKHKLTINDITNNKESACVDKLNIHWYYEDYGDQSATSNEIFHNITD